MRYIGSKSHLTNDIYETVKEYKGGVFCDPFGGMGTVGSQMKKNGFKVISGDIMNFAYFFQTALIGRDEPCTFGRLRSYLNISQEHELEEYLSGITCENGWLVREYAQKRLFFTEENARHIQGCMDSINTWKNMGIISGCEYKVLMASLINSFDRVANTAGTYYAYLKDFNRKSLKSFRFEILEEVRGEESHSYHIDAADLVRNAKYDILYLDPPYNERDYAGYYHLPETVSLGVKPAPKGKCGMFRVAKNRSPYNNKRTAESAFEGLIDSAKAKCIIFHYTDQGLIKQESVRKILSKKGKVEDMYLECRGYNNTHNDKKDSHHLYKVTM